MPEQDVKSVLLENKRKRDAEIAAKNPTPALGSPEPQNITSIPAPVVPSSEPVVPVKKEAVPSTSEPAKSEPKKEPVKPVETQPVVKTSPVVEQEEFKWDADIPDPSQSVETSSVSADIKKIGSALSLDVKSEDEFVSTVKEKLGKLKELETSFEGVPDQLKQAAEIAKKGGDWVAYTNASALDASKLDPIKLFNMEYERSEAQNFAREDGSVDYEKLDEALASIPDGMKRMQGNMIKQNIVAQQSQRQAQIIAQAVAQQEKFQTNLANAARELPTLLSKEIFGITIEPKHASFLYNGIVNGSLIKKHFGEIDPSVLVKLDGKKLMKTLAIAELGERISKFQFTQGEIVGKKSLLKTVTNPELSSSSALPAPDEPETKAEPTTAERLQKMKEKNQPKNSL